MRYINIMLHFSFAVFIFIMENFIWFCALLASLFACLAVARYAHDERWGRPSRRWWRPVRVWYDIAFVENPIVESHERVFFLPTSRYLYLSVWRFVRSLMTRSLQFALSIDTCGASEYEATDHCALATCCSSPAKPRHYGVAKKCKRKRKTTTGAKRWPDPTDGTCTCIDRTHI